MGRGDQSNTSSTPGALKRRGSSSPAALKTNPRGEQGDGEQLQFELGNLAQNIIYRAFRENNINKPDYKFLINDALAAWGKSEVKRRLASEQETGLEARTRRWNFTTPALDTVRDDPRFADCLQVMVDLDLTVFPLIRALRKFGIDLSASDLKDWEGDRSTIGDAIVVACGKPELLFGNNLSEEQKEEKLKLIVDFFEELHTDPDLMKQAGVFEFAPQMLEMMREKGIKIHIMTHRSPEALEPTKLWLDAMEIPYDALVCDQPQSADKIAYCQEEGVQVIFDDRPETIRNAEAVGINAISLAWPYTEEAIRESDGDEVYCWQEMAHVGFAHIEQKVRERAEELGVDLPAEQVAFDSSSVLQNN